MRDDRGSAPRYAQLAILLREEIISGRLKPGARFPSGPAIEDDYAVSHYTAERAIKMLEDEGLVLRRAGAGSWVATEVPQPLVVEVARGTRITARLAREGERGTPGVPVLIVERPGHKAEPFPADRTVIIAG